MTNNEQKYWAFLSYSQLDNGGQHPDAPAAGSLHWGDWLHDALKSFLIPAEFIGQLNGRGEIIPDRIDPIFQAASESTDEAGLSAEVRRALEQSTCLVVVCSPRSAQSPPVNETVRYFKQLGRGEHILPIVIAGEPNASSGNQTGLPAEDECFVPALRHPVQPDGTLDTTRRAGKFIFVDARHGEGKREILAKDDRNAEADLEMAKIQLIALVIGVGFNGLWWREQRRHFFGLTEAQQQAREARSQVSEVRRQLQEAERQIHEARNQALETQNLPRDLHHQIQEAQNQAREAQNQARTAQDQLQEFQNKTRETQAQLEEVRIRALAAERKVLEAQKQAQDVQSLLEETRGQSRVAQNQVLEIQSQPKANPDQLLAAQEQLEQVQQQAQAAQSQLRAQAEEAQSKLLVAQSQVEELQNQARSAQDQLDQAQQQAREAQAKVREIQAQTQDAQNKISAAQNEAKKNHDRIRQARRLTWVFAVLAALALLTAGIAASLVRGQRQTANEVLARAAAEAAGQFDSTQGTLDAERVRQTLQSIAGVGQMENRRRSLDELASAIPRAEISEAIQASPVILDDQERSHFQKWLLIRLGWMNPGAAMNSAGAIESKIVDDKGAGDTGIYFQLAVLDNWMKTDLSAAFDWVSQLPDLDSRQRALEKIVPVLAAADPQKALVRLNGMNPTPAEPIYQRLFQDWAVQDPAQALARHEEVPDRDHDGNILCATITVWADQHPEAALNWVKSQPDSPLKNQALEICIAELAKTNLPQALALAESLADEPWQGEMIRAIGRITDTSSADSGIPREMLELQNAAFPWTTFFLNPNGDEATSVPDKTDALENPSNGGVPGKPEE